MASLSHLVALAVLFATAVLTQEPLLVVPSVSDEVKRNAVETGAASFVRLWEYALQVDGQGPGPAIRVNFEAKTIFAPGEVAMANLIPQDIESPLYGNAELRRSVLKDHLALEPIKPNNPKVKTEEGVKAITFSGKDIHIRTDKKGILTVENVPVRQVMNLSDGTQLYILDDLLFDNRQKINQIFKTRHAEELAKPTGPPLDILGSSNFVPSPQFTGLPGSPFSGFAPILPPAPPPAPPVTPVVRGQVTPLLPPGINPPAPPPGFNTPAPPVGPVVRGPVAPPAVPAGISPPAVPVNSIVNPPPLPPGVKPPAIPVVRGPVAPPALPPGVSPPAPPTDPAAPPRLPPTVDRPPVLPVSPVVRAPVPSQNEVVGANPPAPPPASPTFGPPSPPTGQRGKRAKRQLNFPDLDDLRSLDPVLQGDSSDLALIDFSLSPSSSRSGAGYQNPSKLEKIQVEGSTPGNNRPLSELSSIEQFATLFQLSNSPDSSSIVRVLQEAGLVTMLGLLETSGLLRKLASGDDGPYVLLVPSQSAFSKISRQELFDLARGTDLSYHMIPMRGRPTPEFINDSTFVTLLGPNVRFNVYGDYKFINGVPVTRGDLTFSYGTIQVVDSVLKPPVGDLMSVLVNTGLPLSRITTLLTVAAEFDDGIYTLLAPPDSAISSKGYSWPGLLMQRSLGKNLLQKHILKGTWYSEGLLLRRTMTTLAGTSVTFRRDVDGTITANGIPVRSYNLSASNGVVHVVADVIPDSDLGSDPTAIPNPFIVQTESPVFESFSFGDDLIPDVPVISGLYELPGRDPFKELLPKKAVPESTSVSRSGDLPSSTEGGQTSINIPPSHDGSNQDYSKPSNASNSGVNEPCCQPVNLVLASFLEMLDKTSEDHSRDTLIKSQEQIHEFKFPQNSVKALPLVSTSEQFYGKEAKDDIFGSHVISDILQITTSPPHSKVIVDKPVTTSELIIFLDQTHQPDTGVFTPGGTPEVTGVSGSSQNKLNYTSSDTSPPASQILEGTFLENFKETNQQSIPVAVVPDGPFIWRPEGTITVEERRQMNIVSLMKRLNLTKFAELIEISGLIRTLNLDGPWTVFAPSNEAVDDIPRKALEEMISHPRFLRRVISYHVAPGRFLSANSFRPGSHLPTLHSGHTLELSYYTEGPVAKWVAGGSVISDLDEEANNGVIHIIDQLLYAPYGHIITTISLSPLLTVFSEILSKDPDMQAYLSGSMPLTVFAPEDKSLLNTTISDDPLVRRAWILSHIVEGTWYTAGFSNTWPLVSLSDSTLVTMVLQNPGKFTVNGIDITYTDITAANGVLQVIESPLLSPT